MGTNYYVILNHCDHCGRGDRVHIGKSSFGWTFGFRGYTSAYDCNGLVTPIKSYQDWITYIGDKRIENEYGEKFTLNDFMDIVKSKKDGQRNHAIESQKNNWIDNKDCWLDEEGNSFSGTYFS